MTRITPCPCRGVVPPNPKIIGITYPERDVGRGVAYNCGAGSTHTIPWRVAPSEYRQIAIQVEEARLRRSGDGA